MVVVAVRVWTVGRGRREQRVVRVPNGTRVMVREVAAGAAEGLAQETLMEVRAVMAVSMAAGAEGAVLYLHREQEVLAATAGMVSSSSRIRLPHAGLAATLLSPTSAAGSVKPFSPSASARAGPFPPIGTLPTIRLKPSAEAEREGARMRQTARGLPVEAGENTEKL